MRRTRFRLSGGLLILALASLVAAAEPEAVSFDLSGDWTLARTENFDTYLKQSGTSWLKRKLAKLGSSRLRQTIAQDGRRFEIRSENPVETRTDVFVADGETPRSAETASGDMMTWVARIEGASLVLDGHGDLGHRIIRRELVEGSMVMTVQNPDADTQCKLFFERRAAE